MSLANASLSLSNPRFSGERISALADWALKKQLLTGSNRSLNIPLASAKLARSSSREVRIRVPDLFSLVYFSVGTLPKPQKETVKGHQSLGDLVGKPSARWMLRTFSPHPLTSDARRPGGSEDQRKEQMVHLPRGRGLEGSRARGAWRRCRAVDKASQKKKKHEKTILVSRWPRISPNVARR